MVKVVNNEMITFFIKYGSIGFLEKDIGVGMGISVENYYWEIQISPNEWKRMELR